MIKVYRKTATIKAEQFDGSDEMVDRLLGTDYIFPNGGVDDETDSGLLIATMKGYLELKKGAWIATGVKGEHWPIADDVFNKTYKELPVIPKGVAEYLETSKQELATLFDALDEIFDVLNEESGWIANNQDAFARAWLDGYVVEEDQSNV